MQWVGGTTIPPLFFFSLFLSRSLFLSNLFSSQGSCWRARVATSLSFCVFLSIPTGKAERDRKRSYRSYLSTKDLYCPSVRKWDSYTICRSTKGLSVLPHKDFLSYMSFQKRMPILSVWPRSESYIICLSTKGLLYYLSFHTRIPILPVFPQKDSYIICLLHKRFF